MNQLWNILGSLTIFATALTSPSAAESRRADVVVYGATPGGVCAAIAASREGANVILLEPTEHIGGLNTGGLSFSDSNQTVRSTVMGLFDEWHTRIERDYHERGIELPYRVAVKDQAKWTYEPHVAARVTKQMLDEAKVTVLTGRSLKSVEKEAGTILRLLTNQESFSAKVFIDATYEGDLMAAANVSWTMEREGRADYGESLAGKQYPKKRMSIDGLSSDGKLLPLITTADAGPEAEGDRHVMVYSFRLCLTADPKIRVRFPPPAHYDPARFEAVRRFVKAGGTVGFDMYPLPGGKVDGNNSIGGQFSLGLVGGGNDWCTADAEGRAAIWEAHKQYTLEFYHFLTTDPAVPEAVRHRYAALGLCKDEFVSHGHFSPALYVREGRRMKGMYVVSQKDILDDPEKDDPIVVSSFPIDSHDCQRVALPGGGVINEGTIFPVRRKNTAHGYAYQIPYRSILPLPDECNNLLVPVALSCTHVGISSIRVEPTWMILGQSAGIAAALSARDQVPVQKLSYLRLRERLLAQKQVLDLPRIPENDSPEGTIDPARFDGTILDDEDAELTGKWTHSTTFRPSIRKGYVFSGEKGVTTPREGAATATFRFKPAKSGRYQFLMAYSAHETRAKKVPVTIQIEGKERAFVVDQTIPIPTGKHFREIDVVELSAGEETTIKISNAEVEGFVIVDALQLRPID